MSQQNEPDGGKKPPPFKKSLVDDRDLRKGSPYDYLMGQIRDLTKECQKAAKGDDRYDPGKIAPMVIAKMVDRFTHDGTLREASTLYNVNMQAVEAVIRQDGLLGDPAKNDPAITDDVDGHRAMGVEGSLRLSMDGSDLKATDNVYAQGAQGLRLVKAEPERVTLVDDRVDPFAVLGEARKRQVAGMFKSASAQELPQFTVSADCPFHGEGADAVYKSHLIHSDYMKCTCPKKGQ